MKLDWSQIDTVLLDMDGTLLDLHFDSYFWLQHLPIRYAQIKGCELSQSRDFLFDTLSKKRGTIDWYCVDYWSTKLKVDIAALKAEVAHNIGFRPFAEQFLQALQQTGKKVVLVTNDHRSSLELKLSLTNLGDYLDAIVVSHDFAVAKEQQAFWIDMQQQQPFNPSRSLFIDDTADILSAAQQYGIKHLRHVLQPNTQVRREVISEFVGIACFSDLNAQLQQYLFGSKGVTTT
ncbi:MAG: HAD superfamily hydrolase (TIGR01509 family) [Oceanospirillaceae bacterium]|jgi:HAD superfamily hydrolase (TIGR01509 family)